MRILQVASEAVPFAKTGGLADVVGGLSAWLGSRGHEVTLFLPLYRSVRDAGIPVGEEVLTLEAGAVGPDEAVIRAGPVVEGAEVFLVDVPRLFDRESLYGTQRGDYPDNAERFATFVRAAIAAAGRSVRGPDVIHCHDWQTALVPVFLRAVDGQASPAGLREAGVLLTLHNLAYQGVFPQKTALRAGIPEPAVSSAALDLHGAMSFLKAGIVTADRVSTVSPTYAREIATSALGFGLESVLSALRPPVTGILNAIDTSIWNPRTDALIPARFGAGDLEGKARCKQSLQEEFGLDVLPEVPVLGLVSRLVDQKGLDLIEALSDRLATWPAQFVFLGTGEERYERLLSGLAESLPNVGTRITFSEPLAHLVEAGSDFFLMPSAFEPSGINQMISQAYGTLPIVHRVGGLADTVVHASPAAVEDGSATGIVFEDYDVNALRWAIGYALDLYGRPASMERLRDAAMRRDFSWNVSGRRYEDLYTELARDAARRETTRR